MADTTSAQPATGAPAQDNQSANTQTSAAETTKRVNLHELPEFRQVQANYDRRISEAEQRALRLEQQLEQLTTRDMSEEELSQHRADKVYRYAQSLEAQLAAERAERARMTDFQRLSDKYQTKLGIPVPFSVMAPATDAAHAAELATDYVAEQLEKQRKAEQRQERKEANQVDTGGGRASTPSSRDDEEYRNAKSSVELARAHMRKRLEARGG